MLDIIKKDDLNYKSKCWKTYSFGKYLLPIVFSETYKDTYKLKNFDKGIKTLEKSLK